LPLPGGATVLAYVTGSSLFFIGVVGLRPDQYGLIFSACSAAVMSGALLDGRLASRGISAVLTIGLTLLAAASATLLATTVAGCAQPILVAALLMAVALAFGMTMPNIMNATDAALAVHRRRLRRRSREHSDDGRRGVERVGRSVV
jgi:DHA1 family bicyclomycin/chloramphenicol resistance-like MFS transporter